MATPAKKTAAKKTPPKKPQDRKAPAQKRVTPKKVRQAMPTEVTPVSQWVRASDGSLLELPSGNVCKARNPGMEAFLAEGLIPNSLIPIVNRALEAGETKLDDSEIRAAVRDSQDDHDFFDSTMKMINGVVQYCVLEPTVHAIPRMIDPESQEDRPAFPSERDRSKLYVDDFPMEDRMFIYQWAVGGTRDLETFRRQQQEGVGSLPTS